MSASVMTIQRRTWNGARVLLAALAIAVVVLVSLLIITNNDSGSASTPTRCSLRHRVWRRSPVLINSATPADMVACGTGHPG